MISNVAEDRGKARRRVVSALVGFRFVARTLCHRAEVRALDVVVDYYL